MRRLDGGECKPKRAQVALSEPSQSGPTERRTRFGATPGVAEPWWGPGTRWAAGRPPRARTFAHEVRSTQENLEVAHHLQELVAVDPRVALAVDLADHVLDLLLRQVLAQRPHDSV